MLALVGPTGVGKTEAAIAVARRIPAEIVVVDSMQVYRGMDVGTGKPPEWMRRQVHHHGLDLADPEEEFDVARYVGLVRPRLKEIRGRRKLPLLVGGSGLYLRALMDGICEAPGQDLGLRERLMERERSDGAGTLHSQLKRVDSECAARIHPNDLRRVVRALEVYSLTGEPMSGWQRDTTQSFLKGQEIRVVGLFFQRDLLYQRIEARVDGWLEGGWLEESRRLAQRRLSRTASKALGYQELFAYLRGEHRWAETRRLIHRNTRRYAKRQLAWFRADRRVRWIAGDALSAEEVANRVLENVGKLQ